MIDQGKVQDQMSVGDGIRMAKQEDPELNSSHEPTKTTTTQRATISESEDGRMALIQLGL